MDAIHVYSIISDEQPIAATVTETLLQLVTPATREAALMGFTAVGEVRRRWRCADACRDSAADDSRNVVRCDAGAVQAHESPGLALYGMPQVLQRHGADGEHDPPSVL
jgi:hypothetical protein